MGLRVWLFGLFNSAYLENENVFLLDCSHQSYVYIYIYIISHLSKVSLSLLFKEDVAVMLLFLFLPVVLNKFQTEGFF